CGVNEERFRPGNRDAARERLELPTASFALLHVGSLYDWRALDTLIEALARLDTARVPDCQLWLVGDGVERPRLQALSRELGIAERVRFVGQVPYAQVPEWLVAADVGVVLYKPTRPVPGDPMKIYEYMACGLPVLAGDYPHYGGIVDEAEAGIVADDSDPGALEDAIYRLYEDPEARGGFGERGARVSARDHTWRRRAEQLAALLEKVRTVEAKPRSEASA
ncbi:MAG: glycosyltransferase family 4 protein, partial [Candidatus Latescibacteria bacterium]|nr:glycosyltransferase family 4 protein [Candidatus Latescibacterota bacterium]